MKRILLIQLSLQPPGGGNGVAAWMVEALKHAHTVSVVTWHPIDLASINRYFGTALRREDFTAARAYPWLGRLLDRTPLRLSLLKNCLLLRTGKRRRDDYDVLLTANNEADLGGAGIQYVHFPSFLDPRPESDLRWYHFAILVRAYYRLCYWLADFSMTRMKTNLTLVNSDWTGDQVRALHHIDSTTLYPPAPGVFPDVSWCDREDGFVCVGRLSPEKRVEEMVAILAEVRAAGHDVHLHIVGVADRQAYTAQIRRLTRDHAAWVRLHENIERAELARLLARHRFGIHGMTEEHFGMAVAEMVRAGCIPFVPRGGGQQEIVGGDERLTYRSRADAVAKILRVLREPEQQRALCAHLASRREMFSAETFSQRLRDIVAGFDGAASVDVRRCQDAAGARRE